MVLVHIGWASRSRPNPQLKHLPLKTLAFCVIALHSYPSGPGGMVVAPAQVVQKSNDAIKDSKEGTTMLWTILVILLVLWLLGFIGHVGGGLIHLLLVVALIVFIINLVSGRRAV